MRYKITIEYDGTNYTGWQKQANLPSVVEEIESAVKSLSGQEVEVTGAGRTDAGVHAIGQVAHFDLDKEYKPFKVVMALNNYLRERYLNRINQIKKIVEDYDLPENTNKFLSYSLSENSTQDISIIDCEITNQDFHSRFSAKKRYYKYLILNKKFPSPLYKNKVWEVHQELNIEKMQEAANYLLGKHDFSSFRDSACQANSPIRTLDGIKIYRDGDLIIFEVWAKSFLHHMVRNIVGTLKNVGREKITVNQFKEIFEAKDRTKAGEMSPACGLYFWKIEY